MKAWRVYDNDGDNGTMIVFAETRGQAHAYALRQDDFEGCEWNDLHVRRFKEFDSRYNGKKEADWYDDETRIVLVRDYGWACVDGRDSYCDGCPAKEYCRHWKDYEEDEQW